MKNVLVAAVTVAAPSDWPAVFFADRGRDLDQLWRPVSRQLQHILEVRFLRNNTLN